MLAVAMLQSCNAAMLLYCYIVVGSGGVLALVVVIASSSSSSFSCGSIVAVVYSCCGCRCW